MTAAQFLSGVFFFPSDVSLLPSEAMLTINSNWLIGIPFEQRC